MANWSRNKVDSSNLNKGKEWSLDDQVAIEELNAMINSGLYAQDFAEKLVTNIDTSEVNNIGIPSVSLIDGDGATTDKPYKKFKFSNLKGEKGDPGVGATIVQTTGTSTDDVMSQKAVTDSFSNSVHITEQTLTNEQKTQARTNIEALSSADLTMWSQRLYEETDLNTLANIRNGKAYISEISPITANTPKSNIYGNVISFRSVGGELTQIVMEAQSGKMYYRASATSAGFGTWKEVVLTQSINLENTGYVAFSNGLKIQWGRANMPSEIAVGGLITPTVPLPIAMTSTNYKVLGSSSRSDVNIGYGDSYANSFVLGLRNLGNSAITTSSTYSWVIIGW